MIKKQFLSILLLSITIASSIAQKITIGQFDTLKSKIYSKDIVLKVSVPDEFQDCPDEKFPVIIVLDGSSHFYSLVGMTHRFSHDKYCEITPKMIIVGVDIHNRYNELYPDSDSDNFGNFLKSELIPFIDKNYPTKQYRVFIGHSMGGLRVAHTAIYEPDLFDSFIIIDGSLSEKDFKWYNEAKTKLDEFNPENKRMFVAMAQTMPPSCPQAVEEIKKDTSSHSTHMRAIIDFSERMLQKNSVDNDFFAWKFYPNETHPGVTQIAMYDGLRFIYDYYYDNNWTYNMDAQTKPNDALIRFKNYFEILGERQNTLKYPSEDYFKMYNGGFKRRGQTEKAKVFAKYYLECYPNSEDAKKMIKSYE